MQETASSSANGSSDAITLVGTMTIKPEHEQAFVEFAAATAQTVHANEPGTILYVLHKHPTEPHTYVWVERYRDAEALKAHTDAPYIAEAMSKLPNWLSKPPELIQLSQIVPK
ncbi:antibiotic biosynthesis monooxygenase [Kribbella sancticallisti]|uniref:Antibiotic biosynthesis monooxygenase n=1 Tax=Kribbella sancticallisti TaxID=460087 RepID=A0ABN2DJG1_9ACTN